MADPEYFRHGYTAQTAPRSLAPLFGALAPAPDADYGSLLPVARNRAGSPSWVEKGANLRLALPQIVRDGLLGLVDAMAGTETGELTERGINTLLFGALAGGPAAAPRGAMAAAGARPALPMDTESRLARARALGFGRDVPTVYHGTARDFSEFSAQPGNRTTSGEAARAGTWGAENPEVANAFAELASPAAGSSQGSGQRVLPLWGRAERRAQVRLPESVRDYEVAATLADAWDRGYDAVRLTNYTGPAGHSGEKIWVFKDPNQLRSPHAAFDPAKRDSADLLAGMAAPAPIGFGISPAGQPPSPEEAKAALRRLLSSREY